MDGAAWALLQSVVSGLVGAGVVYYFGIRQLVVQRRLAFVERQLVEFYAPLAGIRKQIFAKSEVRYKISQAAQSAWQDICKSYGTTPMLDHEKRFAPFSKIIEYDNEQFKAELLPKYREMLALFTERYDLAASDTRAFYGPFLEFVEIWNRWIGQSLPAEVIKKLEHSEENVEQFYQHLEAKMESLQMEVSRGGAGWLRSGRN
jgi:hypothetical protein